MINDWKSAIDRGGIKNKIMYRNLRNVDEIAEFAKLNTSN